MAEEPRAEAALTPAQRLRRAVRRFLMLAPDTRCRIMREEFDWQTPVDWSTGGWRGEVKSMMDHVRDTQQRQKFIDRFVDVEVDPDA